VRFHGSGVRAIVLLCWIGLLGVPASATLVSSRAALGGTDFIDWGQFGNDLTAVPNPASGSSNLGIGFTVSKPSGSFERRDQPDGWVGNFTDGDRLLWTLDLPGPISIVLGAPVFGAGANIQAELYGAFVAQISAYDASNSLLEQYTLNGLSDETVGTAIFIGISRAVADIARIEFDLVPNGASFAINRVDLVTVPEPSTGLLVIGGLLGLAGWRRARAR
jgi:hypothetical protein